MPTRDTNIIWGDPTILFVKSTADGLYIMPWKLLHDGYEVVRQESVVSVSPDANIPITHSRFTAAGRIISAKIFTNTEQDWWIWFREAVRNRALPCWVYDLKLKGYMKCYIMEQPSWAPAASSIKGGFVQLKLYAVANSIPVRKFITENMPERIVVEGKNALIYEISEVLY